jgi:hypothetical protein
MAKQVETERTIVSQVMEALGIVLTVAIVGGVLVTIAAVWVNAFGLGDLRDAFYKNSSETERTQYRIEGLQNRIDNIEAAWNSKHPDSKLNQPMAATTTSGGVVIFYGCGSSCSSR